MTALDQADALPILSVGQVVAGETDSNKQWYAPLGVVTRQVARLAERFDSPLNLNVVFQIPGWMLPLDFTGTRTGSYLRKRNLLVVQAALPETPTGDAEAVAVDMISEAIEVAERWASAKKIAADLDGLKSLAAELKGLPRVR